MENWEQTIEKKLTKLRVLESRIQRLEAITNEVMDEIKSEYQQHLMELTHKKEEAQGMLIKIQEAAIHD